MNSVNQGDWASFTQRSISSGTDSAINTLMQQFERVCTPLSKYVQYSFVPTRNAKMLSSSRLEQRRIHPVIQRCKAGRLSWSKSI
jgi:hypothetical protein